MTELIAEMDKSAVSQTECSNTMVGESVQKNLIKASGIVAVLIAALNDGLTLDPGWQIEQLQQVSTVIHLLM